MTSSPVSTVSDTKLAALITAVETLKADNHHGVWGLLVSALRELQSRRATIPVEREIRRIKDRIDLRLNNHLCEMKEGYDDSITGFNEAWDQVREILSEEIDRALLQSPARGKPE